MKTFPQELQAARLRLVKDRPYLASAAWALQPVQKPEIPTMAVDMWWRLYYNHAVVSKWTVEEISGVLYHEICHLLRDHSGRMKDFDPHLSNIAADAEINDDLLREGVKFPLNPVTPKSLGQVDNLLAEEYYAALQQQQTQQEQQSASSQGESAQSNQDDSQSQAEGDCQGDGNGQKDESVQGEGTPSAEQDVGGESQPNPSQTPEGGGQADDAQPGDQGDASGSKGGSADDSKSGDGGESSSSSSADQSSASSSQPGASSEPSDSSGSGRTNGHDGSEPGDGAQTPAPGAGNCGSCATGQPAPWEDEPPKDGSGISQAEGELIRRDVARQIQEHSRSMGDMTGHWKRWAEEKLRPKVNWRKELAAAIRHAVADVAGASDYSYRRPSRRQGQIGNGKVVLPSLRRPIPSVAVVVDTSGSMDDAMVSQALAEISGILKSLGQREGVHVLACDAQVQACSRVFRPEQVQLAGGGGTDMGEGLSAAEKIRPTPQVCIVITDGYTPWPEQPPKMKTIVALTGDGKSPEWAKTIRMEGRA